MKPVSLLSDCRFFRGDKPCNPNKLKDMECNNCIHYSKISNRILIIKLDASGDVLRTTFLLPLIHKEWQKTYVVWVTMPESVELLKNNNLVDEIWTPSPVTLSRLLVQKWDVVFCLSNDHKSASLATVTKSKRYFGYKLSPEGAIVPLSDASTYWVENAAFDRLKRKNIESYQSIMMRMIGLEMIPEEIPKPIYTINKGAYDDIVQYFKSNGLISAKGLIGINVGSGLRWPKKMLSAERIEQLINLLLNQLPEKQICLLGGHSEKEKISRIDSKTIVIDTRKSIHSLGAVISMLDVLITGDTLALHMASALNIPSVVLFGPTSIAEIYDYDRLLCKIIAKDLECLGCYSDCDNPDNCMNIISLQEIVDAVQKQLSYKGKSMAAFGEYV